MSSTTIATKRPRAEVSSPSGVHEDITVRPAASKDSSRRYEEPKWPSEHDADERSVKRTKSSEEVRKARHREVQRRFMERKLQRLETMRLEVERLQRQYALVQALQETAGLTAEQYDLQWQLHKAGALSSIEETGDETTAASAAAAVCRNEYYQSHDMPWDQIFEAVAEPSSTIAL